MAQTSVNGGKVHSHFLSHLSSYPIVSDSIDYVKGNKIVAKSLSITAWGYERFAKPVIPYLKTPYSYFSGYVDWADVFGDKTLTSLETNFPIIKQDTETIKDNAFHVVHYAYDAKDYTFETYDSEYKKCGGNGIVARSRALLSTGLVMGNDGIEYAGRFFHKKQAQSKDAVDGAVAN